MSLILVTALVCVSVAYWRLQQEHAALALDREQLRDELGYLAVYDPEMAYVREGHSNEPLTWKFRVYLPDGQFWLYTKEGTIPNPYFSGSRSISKGPIEGGLFTLDISFDRGDKRWMLSLNTGTEGLSATIDDEVGDWVKRHERPGGIRVTHPQQEFSADKPISLLHLRKRRSDGSSMGIVVYIDATNPELRRNPPTKTGLTPSPE